MKKKDPRLKRIYDEDIGEEIETDRWVRNCKKRVSPASLIALRFLS